MRVWVSVRIRVRVRVRVRIRIRLSCHHASETLSVSLLT
jgi:hypothetical protein